MKFKTVKELINYLEQFNPNAEVLTDMMFSWYKSPTLKENEDSRLSTHILYVYGEYNPYYEQNQNFYRIKDFLIHNYFDKYNDLCSCYLHFTDEEGNPTVEYYLKHKNYWDLDKRNKIHMEIIRGLHEFCLENDMENEFKKVNIFLTQEVFD